MNIELVVKLIRVEKPVKFIIRKKYSKSATAYHQAFIIGDEVCRHIIVVNVGNIIVEGERDIETIIVHELIHAWQAEKGHTDTHGKSFKRKVKQIAGKLGMPRLYLKTIDV